MPSNYEYDVADALRSSLPDIMIEVEILPFLHSPLGFLNGKIFCKHLGGGWRNYYFFVANMKGDWVVFHSGIEPQWILWSIKDIKISHEIISMSNLNGLPIHVYDNGEKMAVGRCKKVCK